MKNDLFEKAPIPKAYMTLAMPVVMSMVVTLIYNMADTFFIARTGNADLVAGVSLGAPVFTLMIALGDIFGLGGSSVISRLFGQQRDEDGRRVSVFCFYGALIIGAVVAMLLYALRMPALRVLGADETTLRHALPYYTGIALGAPLIILNFTPSNQLRTEGLAKEAMIGSVMGTVVNIVLDPLLILAAGMGAAGAAIATVIGYAVSDGYFLWVLCRKSKRLSADPRVMRISKAQIGQILAIGIPASVTNLMQSFGIALTNHYLMQYGSEKVAAMGITLKVNMIAALVLVGIAFGGQPLIGYNYGARNEARLKQAITFGYRLQVMLGAGFALVLGLLAPWLVRLFMQDTAIVEAGADMMRRQLLGMPFMGMTLVSICAFQAAGRAASAFTLSACRQGVILALVMCIGNALAGYDGVITAQPIADVLTAAGAMILLMRWWKSDAAIAGKV